MKNICIIKTGIDVSKILEQLKEYPEDWGSQKNLKNTELLDPNEYLVTADVLQLVMGGVNSQDEYVGDTEVATGDINLNERDVMFEDAAKIAIADLNAAHEGDFEFELIM